MSGVLLFRATTFFTNLDNVDQFYTWYQKLAVSLHHSSLPIWNSNVFSGQSFAGELQPGIFYPINLIWVALFGSTAGISVHALDWLVALHFAIAAFGAYLLFRVLGGQKWSAYLAGLTYAFSGAVAFRAVNQTVIFFGLTLLPYPLYFLAKYHHGIKKLRWLIFSGIFLGLIILSGHIDPFYFAFLALLIFEAGLLYKSFGGWPKFPKQLWLAAKRLAIILGVAIVVSLPQLILSAQYLPNSYRIQAGGYQDINHKIDYGDFSKSFSINIHEFLGGLVDPTGYQIRDGNALFIGILPLGIIVVALAFGRARAKATKLWQRSRGLSSSLITFGVVAALGYVTWFAVVLYELPFVYQIRQLGRYIVLFHLGMMLVLMVALEVIAGQKFNKRQKVGLGLVGAFAIVNSLYLFLLRSHIFNLHFALQFAVLGLGLMGIGLTNDARLKKYGLIVLVVITSAVNGLWFLPNIKPDTETAAAYNLSPNLVRTLEQTNGKYRVEIDSGLPVNTGNIYKFQTTGGYGATVYAPYYNFVHDGKLDPEFIRDILGVQLIASQSGSGLKLDQRESALPKMFVSAKGGSVVRSEYRPLEVTTQTYEDQYQKYSVKVDREGQVIMSEISYPGWKLWIDGQPSKLGTYSIDNIKLLKAFSARAGQHTIELKYQPFGF